MYLLLNCIVLAKLQIPNNHSPSHSSNHPHFSQIIRIIQVHHPSDFQFIRNNCNQKHPGPTAVTTVCSAGNGLRGRGPNWFTNHLLFTKWFLDLWFEELYSTWQTKQINKSFAIYNTIIIADLNHLPLETDGHHKVFCCLEFNVLSWMPPSQRSKKGECRVSAIRTAGYSLTLFLRWQLKSGPKTKTKTFYQDILSLSVVNATKVKTTITRQRSSLTESLSSSVESGAVAALSVKSRVETINFVWIF